VNNMEMNIIQEKLLEFNSDLSTQQIRDFYTKKSFLEIVSKSRNEATHSAFLAWLLQGEEFTNDDAPLLRFLDILVKNSQGIDSPIVSDDALKAAILSRTLELAEVKAVTEQTVKDISTIPSRDRLDIYLTATLAKPVSGKKYLRIIIENKVFSEEMIANEKVPKNVSGPSMDSLNKAQFTGKEAYLKLHQTQRYYSAVVEHPEDKGYNDEAFTIFVFLTPSGSRPTDPHFIPVTYQDLMDYVLEPLSANPGLEAIVKTYLREYISALSVPSISDSDNEFTVLAVSADERERLEKFWKKYEAIIIEAANSNKAKGSEAKDLVLQKFYEKNQPLFMAIYHIMPDKAAVLKQYSTRDYTKYTLKFDGAVLGEHLGKRAVILTAAKALCDGGYNLPAIDSHNRAFFFNEQDFEERHAQRLLSDDAYKNRYTMIETARGRFAICNQWGVGNWDFVDVLLDCAPGKFELIRE